MSAWLTIGTLLLRLVLLLSEMARDRQQQGIGYARAVEDALAQAHRDLAEADAARMQAGAEHDAHPHDDSAFDQEFRRG